jgi:hypothetical protein
LQRRAKTKRKNDESVAISIAYNKKRKRSIERTSKDDLKNLSFLYVGKGSWGFSS